MTDECAKRFNESSFFKIFLEKSVLQVSQMAIFAPLGGEKKLPSPVAVREVVELLLKCYKIYGFLPERGGSDTDDAFGTDVVFGIVAAIGEVLVDYAVLG